MGNIYKQAFDAIEPDEQKKLETIEKLNRYNNESPAFEAETTKRRRSFKTIFFSTKRGIAAFTAAVFIFVTLGVALPVGLWLSGSGLDMLRTISLLRGTMVDMDDVAAFGVMGTGDSGAATVKNVASVRKTAAENEWDDSWDKDLYEWESDYDWDPDKADVLVKISDDGSIEEVVYERTNGRGVVRQDKLGYATKVYVGTEFTYVTYASSRMYDDWVLIQEHLLVHGQSSFSCCHELYQTVIIHHGTGKVFALQDLIPTMTQLIGVKQYTISMYPFDGVIGLAASMYSNSNFLEDIFFELRMDENQNLVYDNLMRDTNFKIRNVKRDIYGNLFILNDRFNEKVGNKLYYTHSALYYGTDKRVYPIDWVDNTIMVYNSNLETEQLLEPLPDMAFVELTSYLDESFYVSGEYAIMHPSYRFPENYVLRNGYLFSVLGTVCKIKTDGKFEKLPQKLQGDFPSEIRYGCILDGELVVYVGPGTAKTVTFVDFSKFDEETNYRAEFKEIIAVECAGSNGEWLIARKTIERAGEGRRFDTMLYYMVTFKDGEPFCELIARHAPNGLYEPAGDYVWSFQKIKGESAG